MVPGDEGGSHSLSRLRRCVAVVNDEVELLAEVVVARPSVQLLPLVCSHEPIKLGMGELPVVVFY